MGMPEDAWKMKLVIPAAGFSAGVHAGAGWDGSS